MRVVDICVYETVKASTIAIIHVLTVPRGYILKDVCLNPCIDMGADTPYDYAGCSITIVKNATYQAVTKVTSSSATASGNITAIGGENCDKRGFVYGTTSQADPGNVTPAASGYDAYVEDSGDFGIGSFTKTLINLVAGTKYYVRSYAHNTGGYDYSDTEIDFYTI